MYRQEAAKLGAAIPNALSAACAIGLFVGPVLEPAARYNETGAFWLAFLGFVSHIMAQMLLRMGYPE